MSASGRNRRKSRGPQNLRLRNGIYYARIKVGKREITRSLHTGDPLVAAEELRAFIEKYRPSTPQADGEQHTWEVAVRRWVRAVSEPPSPETHDEDGQRRRRRKRKKRRLGDKTVQRYTTSLLMLTPFLAGIELSKINNAIITEAIDGRRTDTRSLSDRTVQRDLTALSRLCAKAVSWGWLEFNPVDRFPRDEYAETVEPIELPRPEDVGKFIKRAPGNFARLTRCLELTGARTSEMVSLEPWQVNLNEKWLYLPKTKASRPRVLRLSDAACGALDGALLHLHKNGKWVFWHGPEGEPYKNFSSRFCALATELDVPFSAHYLRHYYAVEYLRAGGNLYDLQLQLGHTSVKTTEMYLDFVPHDVRTRAKLGKGIESAPPISLEVAERSVRQAEKVEQSVEQVKRFSRAKRAADAA